jgi:hypothetical protein
MTRRAIGWGATIALTLGVIAPALARPGYLMAFKQHYNTAAGKPTLNAANCALCHVGAPNQGQFNVWGAALKANLNGGTQVNAQRITQAFQAAEGKTNPATNETFRAMINGDRFPGSTQGGGAGTPGNLGNAPWEAVFNNVNMDGLTKVNAGNWVIQDGVLTYTGGGSGWLRSNKTYTNYSMVVVWKFTGGAGGAKDAGVFLKARQGDNGNPNPNSPQLNIGANQDYGSIGGTTGSRARFDLIKPNDWNIYSITVQNGMASLAINGQIAWERAEGPGLNGAGYVGLQNEGFPFQVAQWWIKPLP